MPTFAAMGKGQSELRELQKKSYLYGCQVVTSYHFYMVHFTQFLFYSSSLFCFHFDESTH